MSYLNDLFLYVNVKSHSLTLLTGTAGPGGAIQNVQFIEHVQLNRSVSLCDGMDQFLSDWNIVRSRRIGVMNSTIILKLTEKGKL